MFISQKAPITNPLNPSQFKSKQYLHYNDQNPYKNPNTKIQWKNLCKFLSKMEVFKNKNIFKWKNTAK